MRHQKSFSWTVKYSEKGKLEIIFKITVYTNYFSLPILFTIHMTVATSAVNNLSFVCTSNISVLPAIDLSAPLRRETTESFFGDL